MAEGKSDKEILATARKRHAHAIEYYSDDRTWQKDDRKFYLGSPDNHWQWPDSVVSARTTANRPIITINKLPQHVKQVTNEQRQNRPQIKILPADDKADPETAQVFNGIIRNIENQSDADLADSIAGENQVASGVGYLRVLTDYVDETSFDQEIRIAPVEDPDTIDIDPEHKNPYGLDAQWAFVSQALTEEEFKAQHPKAQAIDWEGANDKDQQRWYWSDTNGKMVRIAEYFYVEHEEYELYWFEVDGQAIVGSKQTLPPEVMMLTPVKTRKVRKPVVKWCKLTGQEVLDKRDWAGRYIPIVKVIGNCFVIDGKRVVFGHIRNAKDAQRMYNYWTTLEAETYALQPKAPFIIAEGQVEGHEDEWRKANQENQAYLTYKPQAVDGTIVPFPQRQQPISVNTGFLQAKLGAAEDLKGTTSQYNASLGQQGNEQSGVAIRQRQLEGDVANFHYIDNLAYAKRCVGRILVDLIPKIYDTERVARILGEDGEPDYVRIRPGLGKASVPITDQQTGKEIDRIYDPAVGRYDVMVSTGPSYTTQRQEAAALLTELSQGVTDPQLATVIRYLAIKNMDWSGANELADILKKMLPPNLVGDDKGEDPRIEQLMSVIEAQQQQMQQIQQGFEATKIENAKMGTLFDGMKVSIDGYRAETERIAKLFPVPDPSIVAANTPSLMTPQPEMARPM